MVIPLNQICEGKCRGEHKAVARVTDDGVNTFLCKDCVFQLKGPKTRTEYGRQANLLAESYVYLGMADTVSDALSQYAIEIAKQLEAWGITS